MLEFLMGFQEEFSNFLWYLCLFDNRDTTINNIGLSILSSLWGGILLNKSHVYLCISSKDTDATFEDRPMKKFVAALDKESAVFKHLHYLLPKFSEAKVKAGVFNGPQIKKAFECQKFLKLLRLKENGA